MNYWFLSLLFVFVDLNLSLNQLNKLPDELADLTNLLRLDISHNLFLSLPKVVFKMPKLRQLKANNNAIIGEWMPFYQSFSEWVPTIGEWKENSFFPIGLCFSHPFFVYTDVENDEIIASDSLELVDLRKNPLTPLCLDRLRNARVSFHIELPERKLEEWEDLSDV